VPPSPRTGSRKLALPRARRFVRIPLRDALAAGRREVAEKYHNGPEFVVLNVSLEPGIPEGWIRSLRIQFN
jgi:hypothetical protein